MRVLGFRGSMGRHFKALPDYKPGTSITIDKSNFTKHAKQTLDRVLKDEDAIKKPSIYTGEHYYAGRNCTIRIHFWKIKM